MSRFTSTMLPFCAAVLLELLWVNPGFAAWPPNPLINVPVCNQSGDQGSAHGVSDGAGGFLVAWRDYRTGGPEIYSHHIRSDGTHDLNWGLTGRVVWSIPNVYDGFLSTHAVDADGSGGIFVAWNDFRNGSTNADIYVQHVLASGSVDPAWPVNGRQVCNTAGNQYLPRVISDGGTGAFVLWSDQSTHVQHVLGTGSVDPAWPANGLLLASSSGGCRALSDGSGGVFAYFAATDTTLRVQRIRSTGIDPAWPSLGAQITLGGGIGDMIRSNNGVMVYWNSASGVRVQRVGPNGTLDINWPPSGRLVPGIQTFMSDGTGGAIFAWSTVNNNQADEILCGHLLGNSSLDPSWPSEGRDITPTTDQTVGPVLVTDGAGGAIVAWIDDRTYVLRGDIYAHHLLSNGTLDPMWPINGRAMCTAPTTYQRSQHELIQALNGGAIDVWQDSRSYTTKGYDIYCGLVRVNGNIGGPGIIVVPPVTISEMAHTYEPPDVDPYATIRDAVTFPGTGYTSNGFTATLAQGDTVYMRYQAPPGMKFVIHHAPNVVDEILFWNTSWLAAGDAISGTDPSTIVFENASGTMPVESYSYVAVGNAGHVIKCDKEFPILGDFEFSAVQIKLAISKTFAVASQAFGSVSSYSVPSWGVYAQITESSLQASEAAAQATSGYQPLLTIQPLSTVGVPETPKKPATSLRLASRNPARNSFAFDFSVTVATYVRLDVFDISGRHVARLEDSSYLPGVYHSTWDGIGNQGPAPSGVYFVRYAAGNITAAQRIVLVR